MARLGPARELREITGRLAVMALPALVLMGVMLCGGGSGGGDGTDWYFSHKYIWPMHILSGYSLLISAIGVVALIWLIAAIALRGMLKFGRTILTISFCSGRRSPTRCPTGWSR